ncbi:SNF2 family N-terminal domain-containing protein [Fimicolochytrium jonesii]|uniref:SNF2 family N-terminal domain-containing protein n=1 Tax=Fimicolochytrium jonesii TaxID=1396493 RepID=UPI0022FE8C5F|nr:SNF2 family N-terminal domain-containing protein [Fimicolochytrium jonesii]KAI8822857.1 SNF2 family N-terminal domain-containing protein [Fimicolochytrium jonesii]
MLGAGADGDAFINGKEGPAGADLLLPHHKARIDILLKRANLYSTFLARDLEKRQEELRNGFCILGEGGDGGGDVEVGGGADDVGAKALVEEDMDGDIEPPARVMVRKDRGGRRGKRKAAAETRTTSSKRQKPLNPPPTPAPEPLPPPRTTRQPTLVTGGEMREYQLVGMEWLISLYENGLNGILADEMGLGKTLQVIAFLAHLWEVGTRGPFLIVVPLSTLVNWVSEFERFAPTIPVLLYHGPKEERDYLRRNRLSPSSTTPFPIIVTTYEICMRDKNHLQLLKWVYVIVDEGHRLKNLDCKLIRELKSYRSANRLLLTGTPIQNNLSELWSLLNFVQPDIFSDRSAFEQCFDFGDDMTQLTTSVTQKEILQRQLETEFVTQLHEILKPFLLRRIKTEVELSLPPKREYILHAPLTPLQKRLYAATLKGELRETIKAILLGSGKDITAAPVGIGKRKRVVRGSYRELIEDGLEGEVESDSEGEGEGEEDEDGEEEREEKERGVVVGVPNGRDGDKDRVVDIALRAQNLQSPVVQLRKICNHPYLFNLDVALDPQPPYATPSPHSTTGDKTAIPPRSLPTTPPGIVSTSGKMLILHKLLPNLFERGHRVLLFSQMTRVLDLVGRWCEEVMGWEYCRLDGATDVLLRRDEITRFESHPSIPLFLLTTRAGGLGINVTSADTVIIFDSDWNPQMDLQAQDRVHRIGQTKSVVVYRLVAQGTIEERVRGLAEGKRRLGEVVVHRGRHADYKSRQKIQNEELAALLAAECSAIHASSSSSSSSSGLSLDATATLPTTGGEAATQDGSGKMGCGMGILEDDEELERILRRD